MVTPTDDIKLAMVALEKYEESAPPGKDVPLPLRLIAMAEALKTAGKIIAQG